MLTSYEPKQSLPLVDDRRAPQQKTAFTRGNMLRTMDELFHQMDERDHFKQRCDSLRQDRDQLRLDSSKLLRRSERAEWRVRLFGVIAAAELIVILALAAGGKH